MFIVLCCIILIFQPALSSIDQPSVEDNSNLFCNRKGDDCETEASILLRESIEDEEIKVFTVASDLTDGYQRYNRSAYFYKINVETLGMGDVWQGGNMKNLGGGYKINLLKKALQPYESKEKTIILFTDGYDVIFNDDLNEIITKFKKLNANILFGAEHFCWPDPSVEHLYPIVDKGVARFLNSGLFIGYAKSIYEMLTNSPVKNTDDDQLYFTNIYLNEKLRKKINIKLDSKSLIFQNLNGAIAEVLLEYNGFGQPMLVNKIHETQPSVIHGNGPSKLFLNNYGNYLAGAVVNGNCMTCSENNIELNEDKLPKITMGIFIEKATPFLEEFFDSVLTINYPKKKLDLFLHNAIEFHSELVKKFVDEYSSEYASIKIILADDKIEESNARNLFLSHTKNKKTDYLFVLDAEARLDNPLTLRELLKLNRTIISPKMVRPGEVWSNFWGALSEDGYYARSHDYMDITKNDIRGIWNVPFVASCYLVKTSILSKINYSDSKIDAEMAFCQSLRENDIFIYTTNLNDYGHLVNADTYNPILMRPDFYMLQANRKDWEQRYIHPEYAGLLEPNVTFKQPCTDVYWFPIVTEIFCKDLIAIMEHFGKWSDGGSTDERLQGGYEAVPTRDIHMNQVGLDPMWLLFLKLYVRPLQEAVYMGYFHNPPRSLMNFVVRYKPTEQPYLRPHHDSSTYTINIALNSVGIDYTGGGCRFLRYNCSVTDTKMGHMLMHPGRLTHFHEGLHTTNGTRYIMISFVDP